MVSSHVYPGLERKPGGPDNWVEAAGGLPSYIERIAKHLHYEKGMSISRSIAVAVNTVKRWAKGGTVTKHGTTKRITPKTQALAAKAVLEWNAKKRAGDLRLSEELLHLIDMAEAGDVAFDCLDLAQEWLKPQKCKFCKAPASRALLWAEGNAYIPYCLDHEGTAKSKVTNPLTGEHDPNGVNGIYDLHTKKRLDAGAGADLAEHAILSAMNIVDLAERANAIEDPAARHRARQAVLDLASTIPPRNARGRASDGRKSFKGQGKWKHGFIPVTGAAAEAKAKGSPIALKRMKRLFGKAKEDAKGAPNAFPKRSRQAKFAKAAVGTAGDRHAEARKKDPKSVKIDEKSHAVSEGAQDVGQLRHTKFESSAKKPDAGLPDTQKEASKSTRIPKRATQNWDEIPETLKTVRNGKRYVVAEFGGKQYVTEWVGGVHRNTETALQDRKVMSSISSADAANMSVAEIRAMLNNPKTPDSVKKVLNKALKAKNEEAAK